MANTTPRIILLVIPLFLTYFMTAGANPEIGFSARLKVDFHVKKLEWMVVSDWENRGYSIVFEYGIYLDAKKQSASLPFSGIYFISANVLVSSASKMQVKICVAQNICQTSDQNEHTYFIATQGSFQKHEKISLKIFASEDCSVLKDSTFAVQYLGSPSKEPGFLAAFQQNRTLRSRKDLGFSTVQGWQKEDSYAVGSDDGKPRGFGKLSVSCDGMYLITVALALHAKDATYEIDLVSRGTEIRFKRSFKYTGFATVSLVKNMNLSKFDELSLHIKGPQSEDIHILAGSRFSAIFIDRTNSNFDEFFQPLEPKVARSNEEKHIVSNFVPKWAMHKYQRKEPYSIAVPKHGVYVIMIYLNLKVSSLDKITAAAQVFSEGIVTKTSLHGRGQKVDCDVGPKKYERISFTLNGVLALEAHDFITISLRSSCKSRFDILQDSWVSFMAVRSHDIAAGFLLKGQPLTYNSVSYSQRLRLNASFLNVLPHGLSVETKNTEFRFQMRGLYLLAINLVFLRSSSDLKTVSLRIHKKTSSSNENGVRARATKIFDVNITVFEETGSISPVFVQKFEENDRISLSVISDGVLSISTTSSMFLSLVDFVESGRTFVTELQPQSNHVQFNNNGDQNIDSWAPKTSGSTGFSWHKLVIAPEDGYYTVSCYVEVQIKSNMTVPNFEFTLFSYFDDKSINFGLKDKVETNVKANSSIGIFLNIIGVLETKRNSTLRTVLHTNKLGFNATVLSGHLSLTYHGKSNNLPETFRTLQSSTKLLSFGNGDWEYLSKRVYENAKGEFKTGDVKFLGLNYYATKSTIAFVSTATTFHGINGTLEYGVVLLTGTPLTIKGLTVEAKLNSKTPRTVKWSGLVYMEPWQQLTLAVKFQGSSTSQRSHLNARISWSSLSFVAVSYPEGASYFKDGLWGNSKTPMQETLGRWFLYLECQSNRECNAKYHHISKRLPCNTRLSLRRVKPDDVISNDKCVQALALPNFKLTKTQVLEKNLSLFNRSEYPLDKHFSIIDSLKIYIAGNSRSTCEVGILSVKLRISTSSEALYALKAETETQNVTLVASHVQINKGELVEVNTVICLQSLLAIYVENSIALNTTFGENSTVAFSLIDSQVNVEGFSAMQDIEQVLALEPSMTTRLDGWSTQHPFSFDSSFGFKAPFGSFLVQMSGKYLVTANIIVKAPKTSELTMALYRNHLISEAATVKLIHNGSVCTVNLVALVAAGKWNLLELKMTADKHVLLQVLVGSTFSVTLLDQDVSLDRCPTNLLQIKTIDRKETAHRIGADVVLPCSTQDSRYVDFFWLRDGKVVDFTPSSKQGDLMLKSAAENATGTYRCKIATGDFSVVSHAVSVIVYDPKPRINVSNRTIFIKENAPPHQPLAAISVKAATPKANENAFVRLSIQPAEMQQIFYLSPAKTRDKASIIARKRLDYESRKRYHFTLVAVNEDFHGVAQSSLSLQVEVVDQNDNRPEFDRNSYEVNLLENARVGKNVLVLKADDKDTGVNAKVWYSLHNSSDAEYFEIGHESGILYLRKPVTAQKRRHFILFVVAKNEPFSTFVEVNVRVIDINDNRPYFEPTMYRINVTETTKIGSIVSRVYAYDADVDPANRNITFQVMHSTEPAPFKVEVSGNLRIDRKLEALAGKTFTVDVIAFDGQGLASTNRATIVLTVVKTVRVPMFSSGLRFAKDRFRVQVREDVPVGTLLTTVKAHNPGNSHYQLRYVFIEPENHNYFTISEGTGEIFTSLPLDYENSTNHVLTIFACDVDGSSECTAARVEIVVVDVDDNLPNFSQALFEEKVNEEVELGRRVLQVKASDLDLGEYGDVTYSIERSFSGLPFAIGPKNGIISVAKNLSSLESNKYVFVVVASSGVEMIREDRALVEVHVSRKTGKRIPIHLPTFPKKIYQLSVPEDIEIGRMIADPVASTLDNATIQYFMLENSNFTFGTNRTTGGLFVMRKLDYEVRSSYDLFLIAQVKNNSELRSYTRIRVSVIDVNDNRPLFVYQNLDTYVGGSLKPGRFVTRIHAFDQDSGSNSKIRYSIDTNSTVKEFTLDAESGDLRVREIGESKVYVLPLSACDAGMPKQCAYNRITIHVSKNTHMDDLSSSLLSSNYTFVEVEFDVGRYITRQDGELDVRFIAQEVHLNHPYYSQYSQLPSVTWYFVYYGKRESANHLRRFTASQRAFAFQNKSRVRRDVSGERQVLLRFRYGDEEDCGEIWKANKICNGPLQPGTAYRFQLEIRFPGSNSFIKTGFTKAYKTGPLVPKRSPVSVVVAKYRFPYWAALIAIGGALLFLLLVLCICYCCWARSKRKQKYDIGVQKDSLVDESFLTWKTETESQELTVWFSEESVCNGSLSRANSKSCSTKL